MNCSEEYELEINEIEHFKNIMKNLNLMRKEGIGCDLTIEVQEKKIHANKDVLCAASEYFKAMFSHDTIENREGLVKMEGIGYSAVEKCIDFIYTGRLFVSFDKCDEILYSANLMQLHQVCEQIQLLLQSFLDIGTFFEIRRIAVLYSIESLKAFCDKFAVLNIAELSRTKSDEFNSIELGYLKSLISAYTATTDVEIVRFEDIKLGVIIQWVRAKQSDRMEHLLDLLNEIDFSKLTLKYCKYLVDKEPLCRTSNDLLRMLFLTVSERREISAHGLPDVCLLSTTNRSPNALILFNETTENILAYAPSNADTRTLVEYHPFIKKTDFVACASRNYLFVFFKNRTVYYFDIDKPVWQCAPEMLYCHGDLLRCAIHNGHVFVGGECYLEKWDLQMGSKWQNVDLDGNTCNESAIVSFQNSLYLIGGSDASLTAVKEVVKKHPYAKWGPISPMNTACTNPGAVVYQEKIYVCIGEDDEGSTSGNFEIYSSETRSWTSLIIKRPFNGPFSLQQVDDHIVGVGKSSIKVFDLEEESWNKIVRCPTNNMWLLGTTTAFISNST